MANDQAMFRRQLILAALSGVVQNPEVNDDEFRIARWAIRIADAVIETLEEETDERA